MEEGNPILLRLRLQFVRKQNYGWQPSRASVLKSERRNRYGNVHALILRVGTSPGAPVLGGTTKLGGYASGRFSAGLQMLPWRLGARGFTLPSKHSPACVNGEAWLQPIVSACGAVILSLIRASLQTRPPGQPSFGCPISHGMYVTPGMRLDPVAYGNPAAVTTMAPVQHTGGSFDLSLSWQMGSKSSQHIVVHQSTSRGGVSGDSAQNSSSSPKHPLIGVVGELVGLTVMGESVGL